MMYIHFDLATPKQKQKKTDNKATEFRNKKNNKKRSQNKNNSNRC
jgi:hypothetical protein